MACTPQLIWCPCQMIHLAEKSPATGGLTGIRNSSINGWFSLAMPCIPAIFSQVHRMYGSERHMPSGQKWRALWRPVKPILGVSNLPITGQIPVFSFSGCFWCCGSEIVIYHQAKTSPQDNHLHRKIMDKSSIVHSYSKFPEGKSPFPRNSRPQQVATSRPGEGDGHHRSRHRLSSGPNATETCTTCHGGDFSWDFAKMLFPMEYPHVWIKYQMVISKSISIFRSSVVHTWNSSSQES